MRVDVFNGWVDLRDPELVPERLRRPVVQASISAVGLADIDIEAPENAEKVASVIGFFSEFNDLVAVAMLEAWSFDSVISVASLQDLPGRTYDNIRVAVAPFISKLLPDFGVDPDPKAITEPLAD
jgi:hypothetical protein